MEQFDERKRLFPGTEIAALRQSRRHLFTPPALDDVAHYGFTAVAQLVGRRDRRQSSRSYGADIFRGGLPGGCNQARRDGSRLRGRQQIVAPVVDERRLPDIGGASERILDGFLTDGGVAGDGMIERKREARLRHLHAALDQGLELQPAHRLAVALALQEPQPLLVQKQARVIGVDPEIVFRRLRVQCYGCEGQR